jgi:6-phosphogluconolactonase (cycloisomerase 2 family)
MTSRTLWIGTFPRTESEPGGGEGIWRVEFADGRFSGHHLVVTTPSPTFVALHPSGRTLYAVGETASGTLTAFDVDDGGLTLADGVPSGGEGPCHVLATDDEVWVANYLDGVAAVVPVDPATGALAAEQPATHPHTGSGPRTDRQEGPHAHLVAPDGDRVVVCDLGTDQLRAYPRGASSEATPQGAPDATVAATLPPGTGPRHLVHLAGGALAVVGELDAQVHLLVRDGENWSHAGSVPAMGVPIPEGSEALPSHVALSPDGTLLTVGVRGPDVLAVHRVHDDGGTPALEHLADVQLGEGAWPRHHAVLAAAGTRTDGDGDAGELTVVVAAQGTSELIALQVDPASGNGEVTHRLTLPTPPACVLEA